MIKVITCHHYRHNCAELFYLGIERLKREFNIQVYAAITKGDEKSIEIAERNGAKYVLTENKPLGRKWNKAFELASNALGRHILILGEDNVISSHVIDGADWFGDYVNGLKSCAIVDTKTGDALKWRYKDDIQLIGAGRMFLQPPPFKFAKVVRPIRVGDFKLDLNREIMVHENAEEGRVFIKPREVFALWEDGLNSGLDRSSEQNLGLLGYTPYQLPEERTHVIDFKTDSNIHKINEFGGCKPRGDWDWFLSEEEREYIRNTWGI